MLTFSLVIFAKNSSWVISDIPLYQINGPVANPATATIKATGTSTATVTSTPSGASSVTNVGAVLLAVVFGILAF